MDFLIRGVVLEGHQRVSIRGCLLAVGISDHRQTDDLVEQALKLRPTVRVERDLLPRWFMRLRKLGHFSDRHAFLHPFRVLLLGIGFESHVLELLDQWQLQHPTHGVIAVRLEDRLDLLHPFHVNRQAGQLHLNNIHDSRFENRLVNIILIIIKHCLVMLVENEPSGEAIH